jgi:hypothetical protein
MKKNATQPQEKRSTNWNVTEFSLPPQMTLSSEQELKSLIEEVENQLSLEYTTEGASRSTVDLSTFADRRLNGSRIQDRD